jgi:hypothetical protein
MNRLRAAILTGLMVLVTSPVCPASGKAGEMGMVTFHLETEAGGNPKMVFELKDDDKSRFYSRTPVITMKDATAFAPFPSGTGEMYGAMFKLSKAATGRLNSLSNANIGRFLLAQANGRVVDGVLIDKPVNDGFIVIWKGLTQEDIKLFDKVLPRIDSDKDKKNKKKKD